MNIAIAFVEVTSKLMPSEELLNAGRRWPSIVRTNYRTCFTRHSGFGGSGATGSQG
jgi:hypothetical protein